MTPHLLALSRRIQTELVDIEHSVSRAQEAWQEYLDCENDFLLDSVALNLHGFYSGLEKLFERIATGIDNDLPGGSSWHKSLLELMSNDVEGIRPRVISKTTLLQIDEYRRFRHVVRSVYSYKLDPVRLEKLVKSSSDSYHQAEDDLVAFSRWLSGF